MADAIHPFETTMQNYSGKYPSLKGRHPILNWSILLALSLIFASLFDVIRLPAALLLGAMVGSILIAIAEGSPRITRTAFVVAQGIVGCLVARSISSEILISLRADCVLFISVTLVVILACTGMGWVLGRKKILPGTTAIWGCSPGGAAVMTLMSDAHGADMRLVAVMQYSRVVIVTLLATVISHLWTDNSATSPSIFAYWFADVPWADLVGTLALACGASVIAHRLKLPGGALLLPLILASTLQTNDVMHIVLPPWILAPTYAIIGWSIGLRFTRQALLQAAKALPSIFLSIACLVAVCAGIAFALTHLSNIDPLTAYLATSPGGLDSVAIIAASTSGVNIPFVMAFQTARVLIVVFTGPALARFVTRRL